MNVLIIGLGSIAKKHISALLELNLNTKIFALRSSKNSTPHENVKDIFSIDETNNLDFCIISSPTFKHLDDINRVVNLNIPLFIEKPLHHTLDIESIFSTIKQKNIKTYIACNLRFLDCLIFTKKYIKNLNINELNSYCGSFLPDWRPHIDYKSSYSSNSEKGGGVHLDLIHELDYIYWFFGSPKQTNKLLCSNSSLKIDAIDYANYTLQYPTFTANVILNYYRIKPKRTLEILTKNEVIIVDLLTNTVYSNDELIFDSKQNVMDTYKSQMDYFINTMHTAGFNDINEAFEVLKICIK